MRLIRKSAVEALTGARTGQVLSRESNLRVADVVVGSEGNTKSFVICENGFAPAWSTTLCTYGSYLYGSREIPFPALGDGPMVRAVNP
jgi:hypothetical protein